MLTIGSSSANAWYDNNLPPGCTFTASPGTPYKSGGRIYSKVSFKVSGCNGRTFHRVHAIAEASTVLNTIAFYRSDVDGVVPDDAVATISGACKNGNWATTLSLDFGGGYYAFAQGSVVNIRC